MARSNIFPDQHVRCRSAHLRPFAPYVEAQVHSGKWVRVVDDMGFPAGGARTYDADLTGKLRRERSVFASPRICQIYWDNIMISRTSQDNRHDQSCPL